MKKGLLVTGSVIVAAGFGYGLLALLRFVDAYWAYASLALAAFVYVPFTLNLILLPLRSKLWRESYYLSMTQWADVPAALLTLACLHAVAFAELCRWLEFSAEGSFALGASEAVTPVFLMLVAENLFDVLTLSVPNAFDLHLQQLAGVEVRPESTAATALNVSYVLALSLALVSFLLRYYKESVHGEVDWAAAPLPDWRDGDPEALEQARQGALGELEAAGMDELRWQVTELLRFGDRETAERIAEIAKMLQTAYWAEHEELERMLAQRLEEVHAEKRRGVEELRADLNRMLEEWAAQQQQARREFDRERGL